ncbi:MAG: Bro-N domain-containing protein [Saprospiraceae bacterium]|nr:Bro-N domain-containing protein [Saprospiraceae bacterium]
MERAVFFVENLGFAQIFNKKTARSEKIPRAAEVGGFLGTTTKLRLVTKNKHLQMKNELAVFESKTIRSIEHNGEMYFSIVDIIEILTGSPNPSNYWNMLKKRDNQLYTVCVKLKLMGLDGRARPSDCANTEGVLRIIMSVPSPKAEPLKLWLAQTGKQAIDEVLSILVQCY